MATLSTPTFSPVAGFYSTTQTVSFISVGATFFFYTTDGTTPAEVAGVAQGTSIKIAAAATVSVAASHTIKVLAYDATDTDSAVATAAYHIVSITAVPQSGDYVAVGTTLQLTGGVVSGGITNLTDYHSSDTTKATVNSTGLVTGVASGSVTINAFSDELNSVTTSCSLNILSITALSPSSVTLDEIGEVVHLAGGIVSDASSVTWSSSNTAVATVTTGSVTAVSKGTASILATSTELNTLIAMATIMVGSLVMADITHLQSFLTQTIQSISSANPFEKAQQLKLQTALNHLQQNTLTTADLEILQSLLNDQYQQLATAGPYQTGQLTAIKQALANVRALL